MNRSIYTIHIGQCGLQLGHEFWRQMCTIFSINPDGSRNLNSKDISIEKGVFFDETPSSKMIPHAILFDLEPKILTKLRNSNFSQFYFKDNIISDKQSAGNNWVNGYNKADRHKDDIINILRKNIEKCDQIPSFSVFHSLVGGTGSGAGSFILETIKDEFFGKFINSYTVIPNQKQNSDTVVQPYNLILSLRWLTLYCDCVVFFENSSIEKIINSQVTNNKTHFLHINSVIAKIITLSNLAILSSEVYKDNLETVFTPLIPTPNLHFFTSGISNYTVRGETTQKNFLTKFDSIKKMISNHTVSTSFNFGKLISSFHFLNHKTPKIDFYKDLKKAYEENKIKFIDWAPPSVHYLTCFNISEKESFFNEEICFYNHTATKNIFKNTIKEYDILRRRNAFINNYLKEFKHQNGLEIFDDARETIFSLVSEYESADSNFFP